MRAVAVVVGQTVPAEFVFAVGVVAEDPVAASVLFDGALALGTGLGVGLDPVEGLGVAFVLFLPLDHDVAKDGTVVFLAAEETDFLAAGAHGARGTAELFFDKAVFAALPNAPLY